MSEAAETLEEQPLIAHFRELKKRVLIGFVAFALATAIAYHFAESIYGFLVQPLAESFAEGEARRLIFTGLTEAFFTYLKLALFGGFILAFPVIASQVYLFMAPGLYKHEKRVVLPYLVAAPVLFAAGAAMCYYLIFPVAWKFFLSFETPSIAGGMGIQLEAKVSEYLSLVTQLILAFGLSFQLPVVLTLLVRFGMVKTATLRKGRRFAIVIIVTVAAIITPPDLISQVALSIPLYALYELSILACASVERKRVMEDSDL